MSPALTFHRRGIVEGFFGPPWSMSHRAFLFEFGAERGMNTYLYAPKDDPYHRERWPEPYPEADWKALLGLIQSAQKNGIEFVYGFHPGKGLLFSAPELLAQLLAKAARFYEAGVRIFAVLFDDIPSHLEHAEDQREFGASLARAEGEWLKRILERQPASWTDLEWWICPSYYTDDPLLARIFGAFEPFFLDTLSKHLPQTVNCLWTGPSVVSKRITLSHVKKVIKRLQRRLIVWDNYPVNDLTMSSEMHLAPLVGRSARLPEWVYGYLNNPLLQETLSLIPLATCFDYAAHPSNYDPETSWKQVIEERFGPGALAHWQALRDFCERINKSKNGGKIVTLSLTKRSRLKAAHRYILENRGQRWVEEFQPWLKLLERNLT